MKFKRLLCIVMSALLVFVLCACKDDEGGVQSSSVSSEDIKDNSEVNMPDTVYAQIEMEDGGKIVLELYHNIAPITVENFVKLVNKEFYDGVIFHRVISGFMIQGGDPDGTGRGGPGYTIKGEFSKNGVENNIKHVRGVVSMARTNQGYDTAGSQFFIVHADYPSLDGLYAAFGKVVEGMDVVDRIAATRTDINNRPLTDQTIKTIRILESYNKG